MGQSLNYYENKTIFNSKLPVEWQSQSSLDEFEKYLQANWEQRFAFYDDESLCSRQQFIKFIGSGGIKTQNYIGTIVFKGKKINIFPKVFRTDQEDEDTSNLDERHLFRNITHWIEYCRRADYPYVNITSGLDESDDLRELFVALYVRFIEDAMSRGLFFQYEEKTEECGSIKGKIDFVDYVCNKYPQGRPDRFVCTFSTFEFDNKLNRILKFTCKSLLNQTSDAKNVYELRQILNKLNEISDEYCTPKDCDLIRLSKSQLKYKIVLSMSKMFLLNRVSSLELDSQDSFCFLFPTELLFEGFVGGFLSDQLKGLADVRLQASELTLISDVRYQGVSLGKAFTMRHDILVDYPGLGFVVLDTKYKRLTRFEGNPEILSTVASEVTQADLYQIVEYASHRDLDCAYLLYPQFRFEEDEPSDVVLERTSVSGKKISIHIVRLPFVFEEDESHTLDMLKKTINRVFQR